MSTSRASVWTTWVGDWPEIAVLNATVPLVETEPVLGFQVNGTS